jgi:hypothetical protein
MILNLVRSVTSTEFARYAFTDFYLPWKEVDPRCCWAAPAGHVWRKE